MSAELPDWLVDYVLRQDQKRADEVNALLSGLTDRERALVKEAAVMGYVQGLSPLVPVPNDTAIVFQVIEAAQRFPDLYPTLSGTKDEEQ